MNEDEKESLTEMTKRQLETVNEYFQEVLAEKRKELNPNPIRFEPPEPKYHFEGYFTASELVLLGEFLKTLIPTKGGKC